MAGETFVARAVVRAGEKKLARLMASKAGSRLAGLLARNARGLAAAMEHISEHFAPSAAKAAHAVFVPKLRSEAAIKKLLLAVAGKAGRAPVVTRLTHGGEAVGQLAVILEKQFPEAIGTVTKKGVATDLHILRVVMDCTGRLITAYPVDKFFAGAVVGGVVLGGAGGAQASDMPRAVQEEYAAEADAAQGKVDAACGPHGVLEFVLDLLVDPSCTGLEPQEMISDAELAVRVEAALARIEKAFGTPLDPRTRDNIRADLGAIWGRWTPRAD